MTVDFATVGGGTAAAGIKFTPTAGTLVFNPNETAKVFTIPIINTTQFEGTQTVSVALSNPSPNTTLGIAQHGVLSILDDEAAPAAGAEVRGHPVRRGDVLRRRERRHRDDQPGAHRGQRRAGDGHPDHLREARPRPAPEYTPVTTSVVFADGQTTATATVPLINNTTIEGDQTVGLVLSSPTGGATLGPQTAAILTIVDDERDVNGPTVRDVQLLGTGRTITGVVLTFDELLDVARATNPANFSFIALGRDGLLGTRDDRPVGVQSVTYDPLTGNLTVIPAQPLQARRFTQLVVNGAAPAGLTDVRGNLLDGNGDGVAGGSYSISFARAAQLQYTDRNGDVVSLRLARGGVLDLVRAADGEAQIVRLVGARPGRSVLSGSVRRRRGATAAPRSRRSSGSTRRSNRGCGPRRSSSARSSRRAAMPCAGPGLRWFAARGGTRSSGLHPADGTALSPVQRAVGSAQREADAVCPRQLPGLGLGPQRLEDAALGVGHAVDDEGGPGVEEPLGGPLGAGLAPAADPDRQVGEPGAQPPDQVAGRRQADRRQVRQQDQVGEVLRHLLGDLQRRGGVGEDLQRAARGVQEQQPEHPQDQDVGRVVGRHAQDLAHRRAGLGRRRGGVVREIRLPGVRPTASGSSSGVGAAAGCGFGGPAPPPARRGSRR